MDKFQNVKNNHLALAQYHRWYQVYEVPFTEARINNQADILDEDVEIASMAGTTKGKEGLGDRLRLFEGWKNAHHVQNTETKLIGEDELSLEADILYQNIRPDDSRYSYTIHYSTILKLRENDLPVFTKVNLVGTGNIDEPKFETAYPENRAKSFMHYWLYLMETAGVNSAKFKELLAQEFELNLTSTDKITTLEAFEKWTASIPTRVKDSAHYVKDFSVKDNEDGTLSVSVNFEWEGISADDKPMIAETHHEWLLENNLDERFARMKNMKVTAIKPFTVVE